MLGVRLVWQLGAANAIGVDVQDVSSFRAQNRDYLVKRFKFSRKSRRALGIG